MNSPLRVAGICTAGETGAQRSEATAQAPQLARAEATTHVQPVTLGPDSSPHHVPGREGAHLWMVEVFTVLLDRNLQNNRSKRLLPNSHTVLLWHGQLSPTDTRRSAPGAVPPPFCWSSSGCTHVRVRVCLCVCTCVRERRRAGQVNQLGGEQIQSLFYFFYHFLLSWAQGLSGASSFSQGINKGTFFSVIMIKIIIINTAVAYISPASLSPDLKTLGK